jgi:hypothetical protein
MSPGARLPRNERWSRAHRLSSVPELVGREISRIRRLHYVFRGEANTRDGAIELTFSDGSVVMCDAASDWTIEFYGAAWVDPFEEPLSESDRAYLDRFGRWSAFDVSDQMPYGWLIGRQVRQSIPQFNDLLELTGLLIRTDVAVLDLELWAGELRAFVHRD